MQAEMYEITGCPVGRLATMPRPRGGDWLMRELVSLKIRGVTDIVSLLTPAEETELGLQAEQHCCEQLLLRFHRHPVTDRDVPLQPAFDDWLETLVPILRNGGFIAIHCRAGIGRSSVTAAALLCHLGLTGAEAIALISHARGFEIPDTEAQFNFIQAYRPRRKATPPPLPGNLS